MDDQRKQAFKEYSTAVQLKWEKPDIRAASQDAFNEGWRAGVESTQKTPDYI